MSGNLDLNWKFPLQNEDPVQNTASLVKNCPRNGFAGGFESQTELRGQQDKYSSHSQQQRNVGLGHSPPLPPDRRVNVQNLQKTHEDHEYWGPSYRLANDGTTCRRSNAPDNRVRGPGEPIGVMRYQERPLPELSRQLLSMNPYRQGQNTDISTSTSEKSTSNPRHVSSRLLPVETKISARTTTSSTPGSERTSIRRLPQDFNPQNRNFSSQVCLSPRTRFQTQPQAKKYQTMGESLESSTQEGSTVDNIYKQYESEQADEKPPINHQCASNRKIRNDDQLALPQSNPYRREQPTSAFRATLEPDCIRDNHPGASDHDSVWADMSDQNMSGSEAMSSFGISKGSMPRSRAINDLSFDLSHSDISTLPSLPNLEKPKSIHRQNQASASSVQPNSEDSLLEKPSLSNIRVPLELAVIQGLRHESGMSMGSLNGGDLQEDRLATEYLSMVNSKKLESSTIQESGHVVSVDQLRSPYSQYTYDPKAGHYIPYERNKFLTVPSSQTQPAPLSLPSVSDSRIIAASECTDDGGDWETVDSSNKNLNKLVGPSYLFQAKRCGDSIADVSDEGNYDLDSENSHGFLPTTKVTVHPGNDTFQGKFRRLLMPRGRAPVLLPSYDEHKVNGYSADSIRIRPQPNHFHSSPPLKQAHRNPFNSTPPEDLSPVGKRSKSANHFPRRSKIQPAAYVEDDDSESRQGLDPSAGFSTHATMSSSPNHGKAKMVNFAAHPTSGELVIDYNHTRASSPGLDSSINSGSANININSLTQPIIKGTKENTTLLQHPKAAYMKSKPNVSESRPFFHQSNDKKVRTAMKTFAGVHDERPRVFLNDQSSTTLSGMENSEDPYENIPMDFVYKDPRAPVRDPRWKQLYPQSELERIQNGGSGTGRPIAHSPVNIHEQPQLESKSQFPRYTGNLARQQKIWSGTLFWICIWLIPFSLVLLPAYATGYLDWLIQKRSEGLIKCFSKERKGHALLAGLIYWIVAIIAIVVGVILGTKH